MKIAKKLILLMIIAAVAASCGSGDGDKEKEKTAMGEEEWTILFDGTTTGNFRGYGQEHFPEEGWEIVDGTLHCIGSGQGEAGGKGGDIITREKYGNFELSLEWKVSEGGNSGIFYLAQELEDKPIYMSAPEMQILDNEKHPDAKLGEDGNRKAGALYDLIPADPQNTKPAGEWNKVKILVYKGTVVHYQNGEEVLEYHLWTDQWKDMVADSKFADWPEFVNPAKEGYIGLQDHGDDVWFRNIKIKKL
ncbi:MAG: 3-keto-disaccharide hydrolase [Bacteroidota bacterium]